MNNTFIISPKELYNIDYLGYEYTLHKFNDINIHSPESCMYEIIRYIHNIGYITYRCDYKFMCKSVFILSSEGILTNDEIKEFLDTYSLYVIRDMRYKISEQINFEANGKWKTVLKLYDKNMINLLINIPDNTLNILKKNLSLKIQPIYLSFVNYTIINKFLIFTDVFRKLYENKKQRISEKETIFKILYRKQFSLDITREINTYI